MKFPATSIDFVEHKRRRGDYYYPLHSHVRQEFMYVDYGKMVLTLGDTDHVLSAGDCVLIPGGSRHGVHSGADVPFSFLNVAYRGENFEQLTGAILHLSPEERQLMFELRREADGDRMRKDVVLLATLNLLLLQIERRRHDPSDDTYFSGRNRERHRHATVERAITLLENTFSRPLDVESIAREAGVSASHLRRLVRSETGMSLSRHLQRIRIEYAKRMLLWSSDNIDMIAYRVGYRSAPHFSTLFKKATGMTPTEYARSLGGAGATNGPPAGPVHPR